MKSKKSIICTIVAGTFISAGAAAAYAETEEDERIDAPYTVSDFDEHTDTEAAENENGAAANDEKSELPTPDEKSDEKSTEGENDEKTNSGNKENESGDEEKPEDSENAENNDDTENTEDEEKTGEEASDGEDDEKKDDEGGNTDPSEDEKEQENEKNYDISWYDAEKSAYSIEDKQQLRGFMMLVNGLTEEYEDSVDFKDKEISILNHISLDDEEWTPIGRENTPFAGVFDGGGSTISRFHVEAGDDEYGGLFGYITGTIKNFYINRASVKGGEASGMAVGYAAKGSAVSGVTVSGSVSEGRQCGGIAGIAMDEISLCVSNADVSAKECAGGIAAVLDENGTISGCFNFLTTLDMEKVTVQSDGCAGGIAGIANGYIANCENNGFVTAGGSGGGICGIADGAEITRTVSNEAVTSERLYAGGIAGEGSKVQISYCSVLKKPTSTDGISGGIAGALSDSEITRSFTFFERGEDTNCYAVTKDISDNNIIGCFYLDEPQLQPYREEDTENTDENTEEAPKEETNPYDDAGDYTAVIRALSRDAFRNGEAAWLLNTAETAGINEKAWGCNDIHPVLADNGHRPVLKVSTSFNENTGSLVVPDAYVSEGDVVRVLSAPQFRYKLTDLWARGMETKTEYSIEKNPNRFVMPSEDVTVYAVFEPIRSSSEKQDDNSTTGDTEKEENVRYSVIFDANGGAFDAGGENESGTIEKTVVSGRSVKAPESPVKDGYMFDGWALDKNGSAQYDFGDAVIKNLVLYAVYSEVQSYTVTFDMNGSAVKAPPPQNVKEGQPIADPGDAEWEDNTRSFGGWTTSADQQSTKWSFKSDKMPRGDITLYALWLKRDLDFDGAGTSSSPYVIKTEEDFTRLAQKISAGETYDGRCFELAGDITLTVSAGSNTRPFMGDLDGNGHTVTLSIDSGSDYQGMFGYVLKGSISNVKVGGYVSGRNYVGGVAGYVDDGMITDCSSSAVVTASQSYAGGITGYGAVDSSINTGSVSARQYVGGIAGKATADMRNCVNSGSVTGVEGYAGGIAGDGTGQSFSSCSNSGNVTNGNGSGGDEKAYTGGIAGILARADRCENTGDVTGAARTGGIAGRITAMAADCVSAGDISGTVRVGGIAGSAGVGCSISYCVSEGRIEAAGSFAGGISGDSESDCSIENSHSTAFVEASSGYTGGISARGGRVRYSFYYNRNNRGCPVANNAEIITSYCLSADDSADDDFAAPEKSLKAFDEGRVSWLLNTDGGGEFGGGNSRLWSEDGGMPVQANGDAVFAVICDNGGSGNAVYADGKTMSFHKEGETADISYRTNSQSSLKRIELRDYWIENRVIKKLTSEDSSDDYEIIMNGDYRLIGYFDEEEEEPENQDDNKGDKDDGEKKDEQNEEKGESRLKSSASPKVKIRSSERNNDGNNVFGSENGNSDINGSGTGSGSSGGSGTGSGRGGETGGSAQSGGGSSNGGQNNRSSGGQRTDNRIRDAENISTERAENSGQIIKSKNVNIISDNYEDAAVSGIGISAVSAVQNADNSVVVEAVMPETAAEYEIAEYDDNAASEDAGRFDDIQSGSDKLISKISTIDDYTPPQDGTEGREAGILAALAVLLGFITNFISDKRKNKNV